MLLCTVTVFFCLQGLVMSSLECTDWQGKTIANGVYFYPKKNDPCFTCLCEKGYSTGCRDVSCAPPTCQNWKPIQGDCCQFECPDNNGTGSPSLDGDVSGTPTDNTVTDLGLRLVASTVTTFLILALLLFLIHRFRQRRLLMTLRRYSRRREPLDDLDSISYSPDFFGIQCPPYEDPPPPYTPPKPQPGEDPPPYEAIDGNPGGQINEGHQEGNNPSLSCDQNCNNMNGNVMDWEVGAGPHQHSRNHSASVVNNVINGNSNSRGNGNSNGRGNGNSNGRGNGNSNHATNGNNNVTSNGSSNVVTSSESVRLQREGSDRNFECRIENNSLQQNSGNIPALDANDTVDGNLLSVHFRNNQFGQPSITMGVQNRNRNNRNRYSDGNFNLNSNRNMSSRNTQAAVNANTAALNLELQNTVRNFRNRNINSNNRHSVPNTGDLSSSTTDIGESTTSAESLSSSPESPHSHLESRNRERLSADILADDANTTVKRFFDRQFGPVPKGRRYPTTMSQSWTSALVSPTGQNFRQSISLGSFPAKPEPQTAQKSSCSLSGANCAGNRNLPRSKSEHLKTNGSLINQPYKSPSRNASHAGHAVRVAYKEPDELDHKHLHNRNSCDLNFQCRDTSDGVDSNASVCSGQVGNSTSRLTAAILDPGDIIVTRRHDELRKLRLSHLLNKQTCSLDSTSMDSFAHTCNPRQLQRSFSDNSVHSLSVCSETGERSGAGVAISNDAPYPTSSYKNFQQPSTKNRSDNIDSSQSKKLQTSKPFNQQLPTKQLPLGQQLPPNPELPSNQQMQTSQHQSPHHRQSLSKQLATNQVENTPSKDTVRDHTASSSTSETSSCKSTPKKENVKMEVRRKLPDISMIHSWHGGQVDSCDDNISLGRFSMNTLVRNVNRNFDKKPCMDKDVSNMFFPYYKPCNTEVEIDKNCVPSSEMRACASQLYNYETEERQGKKGKKKHLFKRHSAGCIPGPVSEHICNSPHNTQKQYQRLKSSRSSERQSSHRVTENSSKDYARKRVSSRDRKSSKRLLHAGKETNPKVTDLTPPHLLQSHVAPARPSSLNVCRTETFMYDVSDIPASNSNSSVTCGKKRSKSLGRGDAVTSATRSQGSQSRKKKRQPVPATDLFKEELASTLHQYKSQVRSPLSRCPQNGLDKNQGAITQV